MVAPTLFEVISVKKGQKPNLPSLVGQTFHELTVVSEVVPATHPGRREWLCRCSCGNTTVVQTAYLTYGTTKSCGCLKLRRLMERSVTHGMSATRLYKTWSDMRARCYDPNNKRYSVYGGRGIAVCSEWFHGFSAFAKWALANGYTDELTIDRIDVNKNYEPENCRFIPHREQSHNRNWNHQITINGRTQIMKDWADEAGLNYATFVDRVYRGVTGESLLAPVQRGAVAPA